MGVYTAVLLFCVKDNPEIVRITIGCSGVTPVVEILPVTKIIGNILIYLMQTRAYFNLKVGCKLVNTVYYAVSIATLTELIHTRVKNTSSKRFTIIIAIIIIFTN